MRYKLLVKITFQELGLNSRKRYGVFMETL